MKRLVITVIALVFALSSQAQIGKFPGEVSKELGNPVKEQTENGVYSQSYARKGLILKVSYTDGRASKIEASKSETTKDLVKFVVLSDKEIEDILVINASGARWLEKPAQTETQTKSWNRDDGKAVAEYNPISKLLTVKAGSSSSKATNSPAAGNSSETKDFTPFQFSLAPSVSNWPNKTNCHGLKLGVISSKGYVAGLEIPFFGATTANVDGVQLSFVCISEEIQGFQGSIVNISKEFSGVQCGLVNIFKPTADGAIGAEGAQFGIVNHAKKMNGVQLGLVNIITDGMIPFMPFINFNFPKEK